MSDFKAYEMQPAPVQQTSTSNPKELEGMKKTAMHNLPPFSLEQQHKVHNLGAKKYGHFNWREEGVDVNTYLSAIKRHIMEYENALTEGMVPEDDESGAHILAHVCAGCNILMDAQHHGKLIDNYSTPEVKPKTSGKPSNVT